MILATLARPLESKFSNSFILRGSSPKIRFLLKSSTLPTKVISWGQTRTFPIPNQRRLLPNQIVEGRSPSPTWNYRNSQPSLQSPKIERICKLSNLGIMAQLLGMRNQERRRWMEEISERSCPRRDSLIYLSSQLMIFHIWEWMSPVRSRFRWSGDHLLSGIKFEFLLIKPTLQQPGEAVTESLNQQPSNSGQVQSLTPGEGRAILE